MGGGVCAEEYSGRIMVQWKYYWQIVDAAKL
jgi:hypothetical protein